MGLNMINQFLITNSHFRTNAHQSNVRLDFSRSHGIQCNLVDTAVAGNEPELINHSFESTTRNHIEPVNDNNENNNVNDIDL